MRRNKMTPQKTQELAEHLRDLAKKLIEIDKKMRKEDNVHYCEIVWVIGNLEGIAKVLEITNETQNHQNP